MSQKKDPEQEKPQSGFSRRGFMRGVSLSTGALGTGLLESGIAEAAPAAKIGPGPVPVTLTINGKPYKANLEPRVTLLDAMRNYLDLTAAKRVCDRGTCGACTVIVNGKVNYACTMLAIDAQGKSIQTLEGLQSASKPHPVVQAFVNNDAQQCGYCTPGFVMAAKGYLDRHPNPTYEQAKEGLSGNLCRCGTYVGIRKAVLEAAREMKGVRNG